VLRHPVTPPQIGFSSINQPAFIRSMPKTKPRKKSGTKKSASTRRRPKTSTVKSAAARRPKTRAHEKAAIRSDAFAKAILDAKSYTADPQTLGALFQEASAKAAAIPKNALNDLGPYLQAMLRLIRAYGSGAYREIRRDALLTIVAAVSYLVDPFDLIPDEIPFLGFVDDATVIGFAVTRTRDALDEFMIWETTAQ
jgi:uncharacterized membrane protein YkvA (DUF1232 family)